MIEEGYLLHPELFESSPIGKSLMARLLRQRISETLVDDSVPDPGVSVVIRAFNEAVKLELLLEDIQSQTFNSAVEIVVVDNGSSDRTRQVAKSHGAEVVTLSQDKFSYPRSLNVGVAAASNDVIFVTVAHARLSNVHNLHAGARHFNKNHYTAGAFGTVLPNQGASYSERWGATGANGFLARPARRIKRAGPGVLGATAAMIAKPAWEELGRFDERYQAGGEDTALARSMLKNGYAVVQEPAMTVHHSHGLGLRDSVKQYLHWLRVLGKPKQLDRQELLRRRPDLRANASVLDP